MSLDAQAFEDMVRRLRGYYLGCPVCRQEVRNTCYHDGQDFRSIELPLPVPEQERCETCGQVIE